MALYCVGCGNSLAADARFCSACGKQVAVGAFSAAAPRGPLVRPLAGRKIAGVCQGFANSYGWDVTLTRLIVALVIIATIPLGVAAYFLCWLIMPQEPQTAMALPNLNTSS